MLTNKVKENSKKIKFDDSIIKFCSDTKKFTEKKQLLKIKSKDLQKSKIPKVFNTIKYIIKSRSFSSKTKFFALYMLKEIVYIQNNEFIFKIFKKILWKRLFEIIIKIERNDIRSFSKVLNDYCIDDDLIFGLRFFILLSECFKNWATKNKFFEKGFLEIKEKFFIINEDIYWNSDLSDLEKMDKKFIMHFQEFKKKFHIVENEEKKKKVRKYDKEDKIMIKQLQRDRKKFFHEIFRDDINFKNLLIQKKNYEENLIINYDRIHKFLLKKDINENEEELVLNEIELGNDIIEYFDIETKKNNKENLNLKRLRVNICKKMEHIFSGYPEYYSKYLKN